MRSKFFDNVRSVIYHGALNPAQVNGLEAILDAWDTYGDGDNRKLAYILATAHHETGAFKWMREIWGPTNAQRRYEGRADLGNTHQGDGHKYAGRGFVQLTGRTNYQDWTQRIGRNLVAEPDLVLQRDIAARILVQGCMLGTFTGKKLSDFIAFSDMRRVVNGKDKAELIAAYADRFLAAIQASGMQISLPPQPDIPRDPTPTVPLPAPVTKPVPTWVILALVAVVAVVVFLVTR